MSFDGNLWFRIKTLAEHASGWPMDTLHVMVGVILQLLFAWLLRCSLADRRPWLIVVLLEVANEIYDLCFDLWPTIFAQLGEGLRDILGTMILPTLLMLVARHRPGLLVKGR